MIWKAQFINRSSDSRFQYMQKKEMGERKDINANVYMFCLCGCTVICQKFGGRRGHPSQEPSQQRDVYAFYQLFLYRCGLQE